jgi:uncharacterized protein with HEPN domain
MKNKDIIILKKILDYCNQIDEACDMFSNDYNQFVKSSIFQNACCMCILQIGELCKVISVELRNQSTNIPWKSWCGIRDIFAHQYSNLDIESVWETIQIDLPELRKNINDIFEKNI